MVRIIRKINYEPHEVSEKSIGSVLKDLKKMEKMIKKAGNKYLGAKDAKKIQIDISKIRVNLIGAIKP